MSYIKKLSIKRVFNIYDDISRNNLFIFFDIEPGWINAYYMISYICIQENIVTLSDLWLWVKNYGVA